MFVDWRQPLYLCRHLTNHPFICQNLLVEEERSWVHLWLNTWSGIEPTNKKFAPWNTSVKTKPSFSLNPPPSHTRSHKTLHPLHFQQLITHMGLGRAGWRWRWVSCGPLDSQHGQSWCVWTRACGSHIRITHNPSLLCVSLPSVMVAVTGNRLNPPLI